MNSLVCTEAEQERVLCRWTSRCNVGCGEVELWLPLWNLTSCCRLDSVAGKGRLCQASAS